MDLHDRITQECKLPRLKGWHGRFHLLTPDDELISVDNQITTQGAETFLKQMFNADVTDVSSGGNYYLGICGTPTAFADTLASLSAEPSATFGYARKAVTRDATGFPTISTVNGVWRALSKVITWTAAGGAFSQPIVRLFLCNVVSGTAGRLFAYSGALPSSISVVDGQSYQATYEFYFG